MSLCRWARWIRPKRFAFVERACYREIVRFTYAKEVHTIDFTFLATEFRLGNKASLSILRTANSSMIEPLGFRGDYYVDEAGGGLSYLWAYELAMETVEDAVAREPVELLGGAMPLWVGGSSRGPLMLLELVEVPVTNARRRLWGPVMRVRIVNSGRKAQRRPSSSIVYRLLRTSSTRDVDQFAGGFARRSVGIVKSRTFRSPRDEFRKWERQAAKAFV